MSGEASSASFVNSAPGTLTVTKTVVGEGAPADEEFEFRIELTGVVTPPAVSGVDWEGNAGTFTLANGGSKTFVLPDGAEYTVTESNPGENWASAVAGGEGTIAAGETAVAAFTNTYTPPEEPNPPVINPPEPGGDNDQPEDAVPPMLNGDDHFAYIIGYEDGTVRPSGQITRAEVATVIFRLLDPDVRDGNLTMANDFTDVNEGDWYNTAISTLVRLGIVEGRTETTFEPNAPITRAEFATLFARFDESGIEPESGFADVSAHWAREYIGRAAALGWINGYEDGTFRPDNRITRAEAMTMINRVLNREPEDEDDLLPDMRVWSDNQPGTWYYLAVQEATNSHEYIRPNVPYEHWTEITTDPDWERYQ